MSIETLVISSRFRGPSTSGNGGYACGRVAAYIAGVASVRLKAPPPLETELRIEKSESAVRLLDDAKLIAEARPSGLDLRPPVAPDFAEAERASEGFLYFTRHSFPQCFVCGPQRTVGDGLRIFPGAVGSKTMVAAPWIPHESLADSSGNVGNEFLWAALDCTSVFSILPVPEGMTVVLGELCVRIDGVVSPNERCVVIGWPLQIDGRKRFAGSAIFSSQGVAMAVGRATWIEVPKSEFARL